MEFENDRTIRIQYPSQRLFKTIPYQMESAGTDRLSVDQPLHCRRRVPVNFGGEFDVFAFKIWKFTNVFFFAGFLFGTLSCVDGIELHQELGRFGGECGLAKLAGPSDLARVDARLAGDHSARRG